MANCLCTQVCVFVRCVCICICVHASVCVHFLKYSFYIVSDKEQRMGTGKLAQKLRALGALPEYLSLVCSTFIHWLTANYKYTIGHPTPKHLWAQHTLTVYAANTHIHINNFFRSLKIMIVEIFLRITRFYK